MRKCFSLSSTLCSFPGRSAESPCPGRRKHRSGFKSFHLLHANGTRTLHGSTPKLWGKEKRGLAARTGEWIPVMCKFCLSPPLSSELSCPTLDAAVLGARGFSAQQSPATDVTPPWGEHISQTIISRGLKAVFRSIPTSF